MSDDITNQGTGGASLIPSARQSIHNHCGCPFGNYNMNRNVRNRERSGESFNQQAMDVPDGVMSKLAYPIGSSQMKNLLRRNSLDADNKIYTNENETNVLSQSVPKRLPSQLYCRDDSGDEQAPRNENNFFDVSYHSVGTPNSSNSISWSNVNRSESSFSTPKVLESARAFAQREVLESARSLAQTPPHNNSSRIPLFSIIGVLVTVCASFLSIIDMSNVSTYDEIKFNTDISGLGEKYNVDENSILQVQTGISTIFKKQDTGSFMFVYNSDAHNFNPNEFNTFMSEVSFAAAKYLRNDSTPVHYTMVEGAKLDMEEYSELMCRYREDLDRSGVMLVRHIEAIPSELAMAFHFFCDEYNPLVKKSAIFFTLNLAKCPNYTVTTDNKSFRSLIEKCLAKKWSTVHGDSIWPLLTRVVSVVIDVTSAF